jgi:hypothetical protein
MSGANAIFNQYLSGERRPVQGPFTHIEALGLLSIQTKMLMALRGLVAVNSGSGVQLLQQKIKAHHAAHIAIKLASDDCAFPDVAQGSGFRAATPICGNCQHEKRCRVEAGNRTDRSCGLHGWSVMMSGTCRSHVYRPTVAKQLLAGCAA